MKIEELKAYTILEQREMKDLASVGYRLRHNRTGARFTLLQNDEDNKVFYVGFRTPVSDSTGVPHILEHSVLCGSELFPSKDPFVELAKGSLNTFLNAMTYPDKTLYPVASCNEKDFQNLMHVYLDAVFKPNIYHEEKIFRQEGWHYELENAEDDLIINGVVYNEMKGVFSSPGDVLEWEILKSLYPDVTYGHESGGDPEVIPELTYEDFLAFHSRFYHPSNAYFYLYGNMDLAEKLDFIDREYLSRYDAAVLDSIIERQEPFEKPVEATREYSVTEGESLEDATYLSYNMVIGDTLDKESYITLQILDYALCSASGAVLKQTLIDKGIGKEVYSTSENGIKQPYFSIVAKGANLEQKEVFTATIEAVLKEITEKGLDRQALLGAINYYEFRYREADFGTYPKGLMYGLQALDSWLYQDESPFLHIEANDTFAALKEKVDTRYFEEFIKEHMLQNSHKSIVTVVPSKGLTARMEEKLSKRLRAFKDTLSREGVLEIVRQTKALKAYQEEPAAKEDLEKIPLLTRGDMRREAEAFVNEVHEVNGRTLLFHPIFTNGISYLRLVFDLAKVDRGLVPYLGILKAVLGYVDTAQYTYAALFHEINIRTGGIGIAVNTYTDAKDADQFLPAFEVKVKVLYPNLEQAFSLLQEVMFTSKPEDTKRLLEIISELKSRMQSAFTSAGHSVSALRAMSYFSKTAAFSEIINGVPFYRLLEDLEENFEAKKEGLVQNLKALSTQIFRPENLLVDYTADVTEYAGIEEKITSFMQELYTGEVISNPLVLEPVKRNEGFATSAQIQYVAQAGNFVQKGLHYTGALRILKVIMGYEYLWTQIRVLGGAYGCMCSFGRSGDSFFVSYRDPHLGKTLDAYRGAVEFLENFEGDERTITKFIIGAVSDLDVPLPPAAKGNRSMSAYLSHMEYGEVQKERDEVLNVTQEDIRGLAGIVKAVLADGSVCVVGNEEKLRENESVFMVIENLFH